MKKLLLIFIGALVISACANKDVYFNGSEGSHSGMKFDKDTRHALPISYSCMAFLLNDFFLAMWASH